MSQHGLSTLLLGPSLEFKSILPPRHSAFPLLFNDLFFLLMSDQIELVQPLMQGLPKHVGEFRPVD